MNSEEAINAITQFIENYACGSDLIGLNTAIETLKKERPHGEWIEHRQYYMNYFVSEYECSNCRDEVWQKTEWQFCPNCGADMREGDENGTSS